MSAPDYQTLYRFEELIASTLWSLFNVQDLKPKTVNSKPVAQSDRPRTEVFMQSGARFDNHYVLDFEGNRRENGWSGNFTLTAITGPEEKIHSSFVAAIRNFAATLDQIDLTVPPAGLLFSAKEPFIPLAYHEISQIRTAGSTSHHSPEEGHYRTDLHFEFIFAIRADAWPNGLDLLPPVPPKDEIPANAILDNAGDPIRDDAGNLILDNSGN